MPPRLDLCTRCLRASLRGTSPLQSLRYVRHASVQAVTPAPPREQIEYVAHPISRYPPSQPPSHRLPEARRTQLHRQYTSLLRSTAMMLIFQHNNLKATEWMSVRRELASALAAIDQQQADAGLPNTDMADRIRMQIVRTAVFGAAMKVVEFWNPEASEAAINDSTRSPIGSTYTHALSRQAYEATNKKGLETGIEPLLTGPMAIVTFPSYSTEHLKAALSILSPRPPDFPAPTRRTKPGYWDPSTQLAIRKLLLIGARMEGKIMDSEGARWVGSIQGGMEGLRGQLVALLQGAGASVANTLETTTRSLYFTMESRKDMLEKDSKGDSDPEA